MCGPMSMWPSMEFMTWVLASLSESLSPSIGMSLMLDMSWPDLSDMSIPGIDCCALAGADCVCPQAMLHRSRQQEMAIRLTIKIPLPTEDITLSEGGMFLQAVKGYPR